MLFTEFRFIVFFIIVFSVHWTLQKNQHRKILLLLCSYIFYGAWDWRFLSLIWISTFIDYWVGIYLSKTQDNSLKKKWLIFSLITNLGILGLFKYFNFFTASASQFFNFLGLPLDFPTLNVILPAGISFYTFQTLSYSIDVYQGKLKAVKNILDFALFVSFFPQLVAGPIVRASTFLPQLETARKFEQIHFKDCFILFLIGFIKKACISDRFSPIVDQFFSDPEAYTAFSAWLGVLLYTVQIYCDFSGYTDMAIATARLLGYELCINFNFPYFASNISDFWRRWHISLSTWLRDYLYIPLGGNRGGKLTNYRNLMATMVLGGLWHGAGWTFVIWGTLHGIALIIQREWSDNRLKFSSLTQIVKLISPLLTFYWVCVAWIFFRSVDLQTALITINSFVLFQSSGAKTLSFNLVWVLLGLAIVHYATYKHWLNYKLEKIPNSIFAMLYGVTVAVVLMVIAPQYSAFIYFQF
ncbi:MBOAT family O-acyltransferase [Planktothrix agardhii]|jgi:alginate O-acetyltransferase complex protein AlgI|uniref:Membrane bound O-acyl transferase MBOAT family protein n=1 Tax=Planktothrix agardhii (strain NIVA-CYA 126/8) TaxID=388467 RepID=A0A073CPA2_PLAA1|nr:MBOAT family O-acyltransferase [Planktothrix agardhii]KEI65800.1 membrane bound O-acyl transferase MBOAT family protein [Planktothrix agardhii NIVA-CYA 126/8]CAD5919043.1 putative alginate O-acetylase AlgI [Planktothrix agardhii]